MAGRVFPEVGSPDPQKDLKDLQTSQPFHGWRRFLLFTFEARLLGAAVREILP
jgi:hypothetical protein